MKATAQAAESTSRLDRTRTKRPWRHCQCTRIRISHAYLHFAPTSDYGNVTILRANGSTSECFGLIECVEHYQGVFFFFFYFFFFPLLHFFLFFLALVRVFFLEGRKCDYQDVV